MATRLRFTEDGKVVAIDGDGRMICVSPECACHCTRPGIIVRDVERMEIASSFLSVIMTPFTMAEFKAVHAGTNDLRKLKWKTISSMPKVVAESLLACEGMVYSVHSRPICTCPDLIKIIVEETPFAPMSNAVQACGRDVISIGMDMLWGGDWVVCIRDKCKKCNAYRGEEVERTHFLGADYAHRVMGLPVYDAIHGVKTDTRSLSYGVIGPMSYGSVSEMLRRAGIDLNKSSSV